ncbi:MAG: cytochrome c maturation protein CcmE [Chloroflexota bacterium]|nr:cytochrome c maturation protein CcmE [Chloroflexota bacterium]
MSESTILSSPQLDAKPANRQTKFIVGAVIIFVAIAYLVFSAMGSAGAYYFEVSELMEQASEHYGKNVRVSGAVVFDTVDYNSSDLILQFEITDQQANLPVYFNGPKPDSFSRAAEAIVEGEFGEDGVLYANTLLLKCPSRYEEHDGETTPLEYEEIQVEALG